MTAPAQDPEAAQTMAATDRRTPASSREALQRFVQGQSAPALAERLWAWAENDRGLMAELKAWAIEHNAAGDPKALRSAITELLGHHGDYLDCGESDAYALRASRVLNLLSPLLESDPVSLRVLCEHALRCIYPVAESADDSNGEIGGLMEQLMDCLLDALRAAPPPASWLQSWFALMAEDPFGLWDEATVLEAAGIEVQAHYGGRAQKDWQDWQSQHPPAPVSGAGQHASLRDDGERIRLRRRYLNSVNLQGAPLVLKNAMAESAQLPYEFGELVAHCEAQGWFGEALQWAQTAAQRYPDDWRCESDLLRCCEREGLHDASLALLRRRLEKSPNVAAYQTVLQAAERAGHDRAAYRAELFVWAEQHALAQQDTQRQRARQGTPVLHSVDIRVQWLLADGQPVQALALVQQPGTHCDPHTLTALAQQLPATHHAVAVQLLQQVFVTAMQTASSPYSAPLALVRAILVRMPAAEQATWLATLRTQYKPKRNFIAGLP